MQTNSRVTINYPSWKRLNSRTGRIAVVYQERKEALVMFSPSDSIVMKTKYLKEII